MLPNAIVHAAGLDVGSTLVVELDLDALDVVQLRRIRSSYAGTMTSLHVPRADYVAGERAGWPDR